MELHQCDTKLYFFLPEPPPGCPFYEEVVGLPIEVNGSCIGTCAVNTRVSYVCDDSSPVPVGYATCMRDFTWSHLPETCTPASEQNMHYIWNTPHNNYVLDNYEQYNLKCTHSSDYFGRNVLWRKKN